MVLAFQFGKEGLGTFPFKKPCAVQFSGFRDLGAFVECIQVGETEKQAPRHIGHASCSDLAPQRQPVQRGQRHIPGPAFAPVVDLFDKDHELCQCRAKKARKAQCPVGRHVDAEQCGGSRIKRDHLVLSGVENQRSVGKCRKQGIRLVSFVKHECMIAAALQNSLTKFRNLRIIVKYCYR